MNSLISICIPTFRRPEFLLQAVRSCLANEYRPLEIVIGDDSDDGRSELAIRDLTMPDGVDLSYTRHTPALRQGRNVNWLFQHARGERLVLLHDDDLLCPGGLDTLVAGWAGNPGAICVYGKQILVTHVGMPLETETDRYNEFHERTAVRDGVQPSPIAAALLQQMPNNGFLVDSRLARQVGYGSEQDVGHQVDADFGVRLAYSIDNGFFVYVDKIVSALRLTDNSILRSRSSERGQHLFFKTIEALIIKDVDQPARDICLRRLSAEAVLDAAMAGDRRTAMSILLSRHYRLGYTDPRTLFRLLAIAWPFMGRWLNTRLPARQR